MTQGAVQQCPLYNLIQALQLKPRTKSQSTIAGQELMHLQQKTADFGIYLCLVRGPKNIQYHCKAL
jgi:hypothetical protein